MILILTASMTTSVLATEVPTPSPESEVWNENLSIDNTEYKEITQNNINAIQPLSDGYYYWKVTSKKVTSYPYGSWRNGPSGKGPATLTLNNSTSYNRSVTNTISGSYTSVSAIASSLGVTIGKSKTYSASYSVKVPSGKRYQIKYRPQFKKYKVVQTQYYKIDGYSTKTSNTKVSYVKVFSNWDYSWTAL